MDSNLGLNEFHQAAIFNYMRFARYQRNQCLKTTNLCFQDVQDIRLTEETYTRDEVEDLLKNLSENVLNEVESELLNSSHTSIVLLRQLFQQAEHWHLKLTADISELENSELLQQIKTLEEETLAGNRKDKSGSPVKTKLEPLNDSGSAALLQTKIVQLTEDNNRLHEQMKQIEKQIVSVLKEKSQMTEELSKLKTGTPEKQAAGGDNLLNQEVEVLQKQVADLQTQLAKSNDASSYSQQIVENDLTDTKHRLLEATSQLELAEKELDKKFSQTAAYINMKKILMKKNEQMKELRKALASYEPDRKYEDE